VQPLQILYLQGFTALLNKNIFTIESKNFYFSLLIEEKPQSIENKGFTEFLLYKRKIKVSFFPFNRRKATKH